MEEPVEPSFGAKMRGSLSPEFNLLSRRLQQRRNGEPYRSCARAVKRLARGKNGSIHEGLIDRVVFVPGNSDVTVVQGNRRRYAGAAIHRDSVP